MRWCLAQLEQIYRDCEGKKVDIQFLIGLDCVINTAGYIRIPI
jgi:hypothetical protein